MATSKKPPGDKPLPLYRQFPNEYAVWVAMRQRCYNPRCRVYGYYGGRGIRVCARWTGRSGFENFVADLGAQPFKRASVHRTNNDGYYAPGNVCWADATTQARNMRTNRRIEYRGKTKTLVEWAEHLGMKPGTLGARPDKGWTVKKAFAESVVKRARFTPWPPGRRR
jgi:hypothetical protein